MIDKESLAAVCRSVDTARGLPNSHYTDPQTFHAESEAVLAGNWAGLAVGADVPEPGDAKPITFLGRPLLLLRDKDGTIRVFENVCRHRGMILVPEAKRIEGAIRCPYHSWCYSTKGDLVATPHVGGAGHNTHPAIDKSALNLTELRIHIWHDIVFINLSGDAPPFEEVHADLLSRWSEFEQPLYHGGEGSSFQLDVQTNYKLAVENYCESYHLPWVHPGLNSYSRLEDHYHIEAPGRYSGQGTLVYRQFTDEDGAAFPDFESLSDKWDEGAEYVALYPNVLLGIHRDHFFSIILEPVAHDRTIEHIHLYYAAPETKPANRAKNAAMWKEVFEEDILVVEGMQAGRGAPGFDGGRFSPAMDGPTHCYHAWIASQLNARL